jgi:hypothetical protein
LLVGWKRGIYRVQEKKYHEKRLKACMWLGLEVSV